MKVLSEGHAAASVRSPETACTLYGTHSFAMRGGNARQAHVTRTRDRGERRPGLGPVGLQFTFRFSSEFTFAFI